MPEGVVPVWFAEPLTRFGVSVVQRKLGLGVTGVKDMAFGLAVAGWQARRGLSRTGVVDEATAVSLGEAAETWAPPDWWTENLGRDRLAVGRFLRQAGRDGAWLRRLQGSAGRVPSGLIDEATAWLVERDK